jgi:probable HAF family extracellular repeat protein
MMKRTAQNRFKALTSAWVLALLATVAWSQSLTWLGTLPYGDWSWAYGVSADGAVVVGVSNYLGGYGSAFRWTASGGMQDLGTPGGRVSYAYGVSADGAVVVGTAIVDYYDDWGFYNYPRAFRWTVDGGMQDLGDLGGGESEAYGVSADGAVVVGGAFNAAGRWRAFRWTASGGMQDLGTLGVGWSEAYGVSADGAVVVGWAQNAAWQERAFRWTASGGMQDLGTLPGYDKSYASGVSADGAVVVGWAYNAAGRSRAFRWTVDGGMQDLGTLGGDRSVAYAVSADGSVVVGWAQNAAEQGRAFRWTASGGMEDLNTTYASLLTNGSVLWQARAISPDGRYIVGYGYNAATRDYEAFLLDTGFPPRGDVDRNGCVDDADLLAVLFAFGGQGYRNEDLNWDGTIDDADLLQVLFSFGSGC